MPTLLVGSLKPLGAKKASNTKHSKEDRETAMESCKKAIGSLFRLQHRRRTSDWIPFIIEMIMEN